MAAVYDLEHVPRFGLLQGYQHPLVEDEQVDLPVLLKELLDGSLATCDGQVGQQIRKTDEPDGVELLAGLHTEGAGDVGLSGAGGAQNDDVVALLDVLAGRKRGDGGRVQFPTG